MVDCSQIGNLPTLSFVISGVSFPLPPSAYIIQVCLALACISVCVSVRSMVCVCGFAYNDMHIPYLVSLPPAIPEWIPVLLSGNHSHIPALS